MILKRRTGRVAVIAAIIALLLSLFWRLGAPLRAMTPDRLEPGLHLLRADQDGLVFAAVSPEVIEHPRTIDGLPVVDLRLAGHGRLGEAGRPDLPQRGVLIALPPGAEPFVRVVASTTERRMVNQVAPAPERRLVGLDWNQPAAALERFWLSDARRPQFESHYTFDAVVYGQEVPYPATPVSLGPVTRVRDQRVARILIRPVQLNPVSRELIHHRRLDIEVTFVYPAGSPADVSPAGEPRPESATFETLLAGAILNAEQARLWRRSPTRVGGPPKASPCLDANAFRLTVTRTGMHQITYAELVTAGLPGNLSILDSKLRLCYEDSEIDVRVENNNGSSVFGGADRIVFYAQAIKTQETTTNVYWLTYSEGSQGPDGRRMATASEATGQATTVADYAFTTHLEEDHEYIGKFPMTDENDHWYWGFIHYGPAGLTSTLSADFNLNNRSSLSYSVPVTVEVVGHNTFREHRLEIALNGNVLRTASFADSGLTRTYQFTATAPSNLLQDGNNSLSVTAVDNGVTVEHTIWVNWFEISPRRLLVAENERLSFSQRQAGTWRYDSTGFPFGTPVNVYDVSDPLRPRWIKQVNGPNVSLIMTNAGPASYALSTVAARYPVDRITRDTLPAPDLRDLANRADYLIITDPVLEPALAPLISLRQSQNLTVAVAYVQDIFDEFNYGRYDTAAIRDFLAYAYDNWEPPAPSFVLLAGEGSRDHRDIAGLNGPDGNRVPVYLRSGVDSRLGETAADNQYVDFDGDNLPEMLLGRLPGLNVAELSLMVNRIVTYETMPLDPSWRADHLFVADNTFEVEFNCAEDPAGDFFATVGSFLADHFPLERQFFSRLFYAPLPCFPNSRYPVYESYYRNSVTAMQTEIVTAFNRGQQFIIYTGHSSGTRWGKDGTGFLSTTLVQNNLVNGSRTPIMLPMTCLEGSYHWPGTNSLSESLLKRSNGGAVASYAPTGFQVQRGHDFLLDGFYDGIFAGNATLMGEAVYAAKMKLYTDTFSFQDLHDTFMLLGDPAMDMHVWQVSNAAYLPATRR